MNANELRIGNLITFKGDVIGITMIGQFGIQSKSDVEIINAKFATPDLQPIKLTEEWLLKCGFESDTIFGFNIKYKKGNFELWYSKQKNIFLVENLKIIKCEPKYLHQLQNLYFALTNEELTIKL